MKKPKKKLLIKKRKRKYENNVVNLKKNYIYSKLLTYNTYI